MVGYVFDDTVLAALGAGDHVVSVLLASLDDRDIRVCVPAVALARVFGGLSQRECVDLFSVIEAVGNTAVEPVSDAESALELSEFYPTATEDASAAHALACARRHDMSIVTVDRARWQAIEQRLGGLPLVGLLDEPQP